MVKINGGFAGRQDGANVSKSRKLLDAMGRGYRMCC